MKTIEIATSELEEWADNPLKRQQVADRDLRDSIEAVGVKQPLAVIPQDGKFLVVDGNRRLRIAKQFKIEKLLVNVYEDESDPVRLAIILNTTGRGWDQQTLGQLIATTPKALDAVPSRFSGKLKRMVELFGPDYKDFIETYSIAAYDWGINVADYLGRKDDKEFCRQAATWVGRHRMAQKIRVLLQIKAAPAEIEKAIKKDLPLSVVAG